MFGSIVKHTSCVGSVPHMRYDLLTKAGILGSIVVSIPACHAGDRGSIPRRGGLNFEQCLCYTSESIFTGYQA